MTTIIFKEENGLATLTFNRPHARNAISMEMAEELIILLENLSLKEEFKVILLTGSGSAFCAGADLKERKEMSLTQQKRHIGAILKAANLLENIEKPVLAAINGPAIGGGLELAAACDLRICSSNAFFMMPEVPLGAFPGAGGPIRLPKLIGIGWAKYMIFTGARIDAEQALRMGLIQQVTEPGSLMEEAVNMANQLKSYNAAGVGAAKMLMNCTSEMSQAAATVLSGALRYPLNESREWLEGISKYKSGKE